MLLRKTKSQGRQHFGKENRKQKEENWPSEVDRKNN